LMLGEYLDARRIIGDFPPSPEYSHMELLRPLYDTLATDNNPSVSIDEPLDAAYENVLRLIKRGNIAAAMDGLIDILRQDKHFHNDNVRKIMLGLFELLGDNHPLTQNYRRELAMVLF
jgi:putative thioredoxin